MNRRLCLRGFAATFTIGLVPSVALPAAPAPRRLAIQAGRVFDAMSARILGPGTILVDGDRIVDVVSGFVAPDGRLVVDERARTVLPGLIDCHVHPTMSDNSYLVGTPTPGRSAVALSLLAPKNVERTLRAGFTTIRVVGASGGIDALLRDSVARGELPGPRMFVALEPLGPTGGHSDPGNGQLDVSDTEHRRRSIMDGVDQVIRQVRDHHRRGADLIKIMPGGGVGSPGDDPNRLLMTPAELKAAVETAHYLGMKVAAHAEGKAPIDASLAAGVDSVEHGDFADAESFAAFRAHNAFFVPTLSTSEALLIAFREHPDRYPADLRTKIALVATKSIDTLRAAHKAGVRVAFGTDATGLVPHGDNAMEFALMVRAGMRPVDAILAATRNAADLIGSAELGRIRTGAYADLIAVDGDPLEDISELSRVRWVMKGGSEVLPY